MSTIPPTDDTPDSHETPDPAYPTGPARKGAEPLFSDPSTVEAKDDFFAVDAARSSTGTAVPVGPLQETPGSYSDTSRSKPPLRKPVRTRRGPLIAFLGLIVIVSVGGVAAWLWWDNSRPKEISKPDSGTTSPGTTSPGATSPGATPPGATPPGATPAAATDISADLAAVLALQDEELESLDLDASTFDDEHPLGRMYVRLEKRELKGKERGAFISWANAKKVQVQNTDVRVFLRIIGTTDSIFPVQSDVNEDSKASSTLDVSFQTSPLPGIEFFAAAAQVMLSGRGLHLACFGMLQDDAENLPDDYPPPANLSPEDVSEWRITVRFFKKNRSVESKIDYLFRLIGLCEKVADHKRSKELRGRIERIMEGLAESNPAMAQNYKLRLGLTEVKNEADMAKRTAADATKQAVDAKAAADTAEAAANEAKTKAADAEAAAQKLATAVLLAPAQLSAALQGTGRTIASLDLAQLPPDLDEDSRTDLTNRRLVVEKLQKELELLVAPESPPLDAAMSMDARTKLQLLYAQLSGLTVDFVLRRGTAGPALKWDSDGLRLLLDQIESWTKQVSPAAVTPERLDELLEEIADIRKVLSEPAKISAQEGAKLVIRLQRLAHGITALQVAGAYQQNASRTHVSRKSLNDFWTRLTLTDERIRELQPEANAPEMLVHAWKTLSESVPRINDSLRNLDGLTPDQEVELTVQIGLAAHALTLLDAGGLPRGSSGGGTADLRPLWSAIRLANAEVEKLRPLASKVTSLGARIGDLESRVNQLRAQETIDPRLLEALQKELRNLSKNTADADVRFTKLEADLRRMETTPRAVPEEQANIILAKSVEGALAELAKYGYVPAPGNRPGPPIIEPELPEADPRLARMFASTGFADYYAGCPDQLKRAADQFGAAVKHDPRSPTYRYFLALTLYRLGRTAEAEAQVRAGRDLERKQPALKIDRELGRVQGSIRTWLELIRHGV